MDSTESTSTSTPLSPLQQLASLTREQASTIEEQTKRISELEKQEKNHTETIASLEQKLRTANDRIVTLSGSDKQLKESANIRRQADLDVKAAEKKVQKAQEDAQMTKHWAKKEIEAEHEALAKKDRIYDPFLFVTLAYGILVTWLAGLQQPAFQAACAQFGQGAGVFFGAIWNYILEMGEGISSQIAALISDAGWSQSVRWTVWIAVSGGVWFLIGWLAVKGLRRFVPFFRRRLANRQTAIVILVICAVCIFGAGPIGTVVNPVLLLILVAVGYLIIRGVRLHSD